jgi:hypothetical protein
MKVKLFSLALSLSALATSAVAQTSNDEALFEKKKSYSKSYSLSSGDKIKLYNEFGEMKLVGWDKNEIKVEVSMTGGSSESETRAQQILDRISIEDGKGSDGIFFRTKLSNTNQADGTTTTYGNLTNGTVTSDKGTKKGYKHETLKINYTVYLPTNNPITAENKFGALIVPDYKGAAVFSSSFGSFTAGRLTAVKSVNVEFGKADIASIDGGKVTIKYSSGSINHLSGEVDARIEFCDKLKITIDNDIRDFDLKTSYSNVYLDVNKGLSANYDIVSNYGELTNSSTFTLNKQSDENRYYSSSSRFSGTSGSGGSKMKIRNEFGKVTLGHDLKVDMTAGKKGAKI